LLVLLLVFVAVLVAFEVLFTSDVLFVFTFVVVSVLSCAYTFPTIIKRTANELVIILFILVSLEELPKGHLPRLFYFMYTSKNA
jgi:hypothetical protein